MSSQRPKSPLRLRLEAPATPERVIQVARLFQELVRAASGDLAPDSVTMVVQNHALRAELRGWTPHARAVVKVVEAVVRNPQRAVAKSPAAGLVADVFGTYARPLVDQHAVFTRPGTRRPVAVVDDKFVESMRIAARSARESTHVVRGTTMVYSAVYRVGRVDEGRPTAARIRLDGKPHDVVADDAAVASLFDAARSTQLMRIHLAAEWLPDNKGRLVYNTSRTRIVRVDGPVDPISGRELLELTRGLAPPLTDEDIASIREQLEG